MFEAILEERKLYEKHRNRRKREFQDLDYICCSSYGRPRSKSFHWKHYKRLLSDNGLPDIIEDCIPEIIDFIDEVMPEEDVDEKFKKELLEIVIDTTEYLREIS